MGLLGEELVNAGLMKKSEFEKIKRQKPKPKLKVQKQQKLIRGIPEDKLKKFITFYKLGMSTGQKITEAIMLGVIGAEGKGLTAQQIGSKCLLYRLAAVQYMKTIDGVKQALFGDL